MSITILFCSFILSCCVLLAVEAMLAHKGLKHVWEDHKSQMGPSPMVQVKRFIELRDVSRVYSLDNEQADEFNVLHALVIA